VVHGDFRLGNVLVGDRGLAAVLDWELAHVGDPAEDLGWLCVRAWRFGGAAPVAGLGEREDLLAGYAAAGGRPIDPGVLRWWEVLGTLRWGAICMLQAQVHLSGGSRSVELAAIGRRTCEAEYDLWLLLEPDEERRSLWAAATAATPVPTAAVPPGPHDRPTAVELLDAVREHLERDVLDATEGRTRFHARVAANVVAMVGRELDQGAGPAVAHRARLASLGCEDDTELADRLRSGELPAGAADVRRTVWSSVLTKVLVANPGYVEAEAAAGSTPP
jgi:hypothetical protein